MTSMRWATLSLLLLGFAGCRDATPAPSPTATAPSPALSASTKPATLTRVTDVSSVCMVNDRYLGAPQIPVSVGGKTYFGCCAMCKQKLENNEDARFALDPVSGKRVDKASAVIARTASGRVFYFEAEENLRRYEAAAL